LLAEAAVKRHEALAASSPQPFPYNAGHRSEWPFETPPPAPPASPSLRQIAERVLSDRVEEERLLAELETLIASDSEYANHLLLELLFSN
jgi:hypothetical protein